MDKSLNILCYQPYNQTVVYIESIIEKMAKNGHNTFFLSFAKRGDTHENMERFGCKTYSLAKPVNIPLIYHFLRVWQLASFCKKHKIDIIYAHYQEANIIAALGQFFVKAKCVLTRHHSDCGYLDHNWKEIFADKIINNLAKVCIAPSDKVYDQMVNIEGCKPDKVIRINYGYNFDNFAPANVARVKAIRKEYCALLLIVMAARFIPEKRHLLLFEVIKQLISEGYDIKVMVPGRGPEENTLKEYVSENHLQRAILFPGFRRDIQNYFASADLIVHLSVSEASNSAIKEAALLEKTAIVCKGVGDFDDYFINGKNGFLIDQENTGQQLVALLKQVYHEKEKLEDQGKQLKAIVMQKFSIDAVYPVYEKLHNKLFAG